jgi:hypothetical protein
MKKSLFSKSATSIFNSWFLVNESMNNINNNQMNFQQQHKFMMMILIIHIINMQTSQFCVNIFFIVFVALLEPV